MLRVWGQTTGKETPAKPICQIEKHRGVRAQSLEYFLITLHVESVGDQSSRTYASFVAALSLCRQKTTLYETFDCMCVYSFIELYIYVQYGTTTE